MTTINTSDYGDIRVLAVERINSIQPEKVQFTYPENCNPDEKLQHAFGMFYDDPLEVAIWFSASQARYIQEGIWAMDQQIAEQTLLLRRPLRKLSSHPESLWLCGGCVRPLADRIDCPCPLNEEQKML